MARFWWNNAGDKQGINWTIQNKLCHSKENGGLRFRSLEEFNRALLARQCWRILTNENSLVSKVFKAKYFRNSSFLEANLGHYPFHVWRSLLWGSEVLKHGLIWCVGSGIDIWVYEDNWLPRPSIFKIYSPKTSTSINFVLDLLSPLGSWNHDIL